jgi:hypothetical protein
MLGFAVLSPTYRSVLFFSSAAKALRQSAQVAFPEQKAEHVLLDDFDAA